MSHLVGAANRADIRRLALLEKENADLSGKIEKQQSRLREAIVVRDETIRRLGNQLAERLAITVPTKEEADSESAAEIAMLKNLVSSLQRRLVNEANRREKAEARAQNAGVALADAQGSLSAAQRLQSELQAEVQAAESQLSVARNDDMAYTETLRDTVGGRTVLYVGGRPGSTQAMRDLVQGAGGKFVSHDGGIEHRSGLLAGEVRGADFIFFPVDCISHDAVGALKRLCAQAAKRYRPLRTASVASFLAGLRNEFAESERLAEVE